jgi:predicted O-methyltransferase YrrM
MLEALAKHGEHARLTTLEGSELQHALSSALLKQHYGDKVSCVYGWTGQLLAELVTSVGQVDFMFHDAGHSRLDYTRDFNAVVPVLAPGAVVLIDDIRWSDPRFFKGDPQCYRGWRDIADHSRVGRAVEIDDSMGLLLITD